jgi:hypothetical protein
MILATHGFLASYNAPKPIVSDTDAQAFIDRVYTAGGSLSSTEANAVNDLVLDMKADSIWTKMKAIYPMVGASSAACSQNLKSSSFTGSFSTGWTFSSIGVTGNGSSSFLNTQLNLSTQLINTSCHLSVYVTNNTVGGHYDIGSSTDSNGDVNPTYLITRFTGNYSYFGIGDGSFSTNFPSTDSKGFWLGLTNGNTTQRFYKNASQIATGSAATIANQNLYIGARNSGGVAKVFSNKNYAFASIGEGLTTTEASNFYTAVQAFQTTLSRNV